MKLNPVSLRGQDNFCILTTKKKRASDNENLKIYYL